MRLAVALTIILGATAVACQKDATTQASTPESQQPMEIDTHECSACGMVVREQPAPRGQAVHRDGTREFFCSIADLVHYSRTPSPHGSITHVFVETLDPAADPQLPDATARPWTTTDKAQFVVDLARPGVMGKPVLVYDASTDVGAVTSQHGGRAVTWEEVEAHVLSPVSKAAPPDREVIKGERVLMGTHFEIQIASPDRARAGHAIDAAFDEVARVEALLSEWRDDSEISEVNRSAAKGPVKVGPELLEVVQRSIEISTLTDGAFDITFAACNGLWSFRTPRIPTDDDLKKCLQHVGTDLLLVDEEASTIGFKSPGTKIGIAAIGKGYGVDRAAAVLKSKGFDNFFVDGGGELHVNGVRFERPWTVGIAHPRKPGTLLRTLALSDGAVATSGDYEQYFEQDGARFHHILDPRTGKPAPASVAVTVLAPNTTQADALATAFFVMGPTPALALAETLPDVEALIIDPDLVVHTSSGWR